MKDLNILPYIFLNKKHKVSHKSVDGEHMKLKVFKFLPTYILRKGIYDLQDIWMIFVQNRYDKDVYWVENNEDFINVRWLVKEICETLGINPDNITFIDLENKENPSHTSEDFRKIVRKIVYINDEPDEWSK